MKLFASLKKQNRILLIGASIVVAIVGYYNLFYLPQLKVVKALRQEIANLEAIIKTMREAGITTVDSAADKFRLRLRMKEFAELEERLNQAEQRLLTKEAVSQYLSKLTTLCNQNRVEVTFFAPHPEKEINGKLFYQGLPLELSIRTTWFDVIKLLDGLQRLPSLAILRDIELRLDRERPPYIDGKLIVELWLSD